MSIQFDRGDDYRVLVLPATRRDGQVTCNVLIRSGLPCFVCADAEDLAAQIEHGTGVIILTDAIAGDLQLTLLFAALSRQPPWSDTPTILLSRVDLQSVSITRLTTALTNVTVLDRPTSARTLISAVHAAIRGRRRQYEIRDRLQELTQAQEALRDADRRKDEFLAMLAHELRNPLAPIRTATELLARQLPQKSESHATVEIVKRQVVHLTRLVDDLLDVSRITQGRIQLQRRTLDLSSIVTQAVESVEPLFSEKHHTVVREINPSSLYVEGDSARLVQCMTNLLTNSAKYTDPGGEISIEMHEERTGAVISVTDTGIGIASELLPSIFDLFVQSDRSLDRSQGGLGIGLSVVQRLVEMHGGTVTATSAGLNKGSTFKIWLPLIAPPAELAEESVQPQIHPKRVLVVDDNVDAAKSLAEVLRLDGHIAEAVHTAETALQSVADFAPDVVLLDIGLPDMNGYQVAERIRAAGNPVRLIALTGYGQEENRMQTRSAGFYAHLVKPVDFETLEQVISEGKGTCLRSERQDSAWPD